MPSEYHLQKMKLAASYKAFKISFFHQAKLRKQQITELSKRLIELLEHKPYNAENGIVHLLRHMMLIHSKNIFYSENLSQLKKHIQEIGITFELTNEEKLYLCKYLWEYCQTRKIKVDINYPHQQGKQDLTNKHPRLVNIAVVINSFEFLEWLISIGAEIHVRSWVNELYTPLALAITLHGFKDIVTVTDKIIHYLLQMSRHLQLGDQYYTDYVLVPALQATNIALRDETHYINLLTLILQQGANLFIPCHFGQKNKARNKIIDYAGPTRKYLIKAVANVLSDFSSAQFKPSSFLYMQQLGSYPKKYARGYSLREKLLLQAYLTFNETQLVTLLTYAPELSSKWEDNNIFESASGYVYHLLKEEVWQYDEAKLRQFKKNKLIELIGNLELTSATLAWLHVSAFDDCSHEALIACITAIENDLTENQLQDYLNKKIDEERCLCFNKLASSVYCFASLLAPYETKDSLIKEYLSRLKNTCERHSEHFRANVGAEFASYYGWSHYTDREKKDLSTRYDDDLTINEEENIQSPKPF